MEQKIDGTEVEDKVFGRLVGTILPDSVTVVDSKVSFRFVADSGNEHFFNIGDERVLSKLFSLYGASYRKVKTDIKLGLVGVSWTNRDAKKAELYATNTDFLRGLVRDNDRKIVLLLNDKTEVVSIVSEQHKQLPLSKAFEIVDSIAKSKGAVFVGRSEENGSYKVVYEVGQNGAMSLRVIAHLGRNDALGRAGISYSGGGHVFVCSNMIVPYIDQDVKASLGGSELLSVKIVHTTNVESRLREQLVKSFDSAKNNINVLAQKFEESKLVKMSRALQEHCIKLIVLKAELSDCWAWRVRRQLRNEEETLYGLSQALTWVGSHMAGEKEIGVKLQKLGGQVVILGEKFVELITKSLQAKAIEVPVLHVSA